MKTRQQHQAEIRRQLDAIRMLTLEIRNVAAGHASPHTPDELIDELRQLMGDIAGARAALARDYPFALCAANAR